jgi:hypothetical protein
MRGLHNNGLTFFAGVIAQPYDLATPVFVYFSIIT